ncbi:efflux RND transporter periplasmic adaptor subunit [Litorisediminicola beolgyonensis]|uniref:Efflux RND transporter periplasmic adaptor subunit n=1 Tax=Litorisediminicola beolgyonensis TaxID=1173614 RepID=A0ABW3ZMK8_9RHOB
MRFLRRSLTGLFLLAVTAGLLLWAGVILRDAVTARMNDAPRVPEARERVFTVNVVEARAGTETPVLTAFGQVETRRELELRAASAGRIVELADAVEEGGRVAAGALIARIDPAEAQDGLARARADLSDAEDARREAARAVALAEDNLAASEEEVGLYDRALQRQRDLESRGVGSASAVENAELAASGARTAVLQRRQSLAEAEARVDQAATQLSRAEIALGEAERRLAETEIRAGFAGTLADVAVVEGGLVSANERIARLIDPEALEVAFRVPVQSYARLLDGEGQLAEAEVTVVLDVFGTDIEAEGVIDRAAAAVGEGETGRLVYARLGSSPGFRPGDFVTVRITEAPIDGVVRLPATALDASGTVLVLGDEDRLEARQVTLLRRQGDDVLVAGEGLDGARVVAQRTPLLGPGIKVRPNGGAGAEAAEGRDMVALTEARRARLVAYVEGNARMPEAAKERILSQLREPEVPAEVVDRIEARIGG